MKACKFYIDRNYLSEKLGIDENQFVIGEVEFNYSEVGITIFIDENANPTTDIKPVDIDSGILNIRREKL